MRKISNVCVTVVLGASWPAMAAMTCPPMPAAVTDVSRTVKSDISASVGSLGKLKAGEVAVKTDVEANAILSKHPNVDRMLVLQTMASTYCTLLQSTTLSDIEKLDRWERFQERVLNLQQSASVAPPISPPERKAPVVLDEKKPAAIKSSVQAPNPATARAPETETEPTSLTDYLRQISGTSDKEKKRQLKAGARALVAPAFNFGTVSWSDSVWDNRLAFVSYSPITNQLVLDEWKTYKNSASCGQTCRHFDGRLTISLERIDRLKAYTDGFEIGCYYSYEQSGTCISIKVNSSTCGGSRCTNGPGQDVSIFEVGSIQGVSGLSKLQKVLKTIIYDIDGRPPK